MAIFSRYETNPEVLTTFNASYLIPLKCFKVIPNGRYKLDIGTISRMFALKVPVMGKLKLRAGAWYIPYDLVDEKFDKLITEGHDNSFDEDVYGRGSHNPNTESIGKSIVPDLYTPKLVSSKNKDGFEVFSGDLLNRLGLPIANQNAHDKSIKYDEDLKKSCTITNENGEIVFDEQRYKKLKKRIVPAYIKNDEFCAYAPRAYYLIRNTHFRAKFLEDDLPIDFAMRESDPDNYTLQRVNRTGDWFSRGFVSAELNPVDIPLAIGETIPVELDSPYASIDSVVDMNEVSIVKDGNFRFGANGSEADVHISNGDFHSLEMPQWSSGSDGYAQYVKGLMLNGIGRISGNGAMVGALHPRVNISNAVQMNIDDLRYAIGLSHISQKAIKGTDLATMLKLNFDLDLPKSRLEEPLMFGFKEIPIQVNQITQTAPASKDDDPSSIGDVYGQSTTIDRLDDNNWRFKAYNYGLIMVCVWVVHESVFQYGVDPIFTEHDKFDFFQPDLMGLSMFSIPKKYIYYTGTETDEETFNFNEPYSELMYDHNVVNGEFSSDSEASLDFYHLADIYDGVPSFDAEWIKDTTKEVLDRSLTITSDVSDQFQAYFKMTFTRVLPKASYQFGFRYI